LRGDVVSTFTDRPPYPLDNDAPLAGTHHGCLSILLDPFSRRRTCELFPNGLRGRRCLDVGAGVGAWYARWLAEQVGPTGPVTAADIKPRDIPAHPRLAVSECDLNAPDWPFAGERFDFIHARLTLGHLPDRQRILRRLIGLLAPGGWILVEDWDATRTDMILHAPSLQAAEEYAMVQETVGRIFAAAGTDWTWARRIHAALPRTAWLRCTPSCTPSPGPVAGPALTSPQPPSPSCGRRCPPPRPRVPADPRPLARQSAVHRLPKQSIAVAWRAPGTTIGIHRMSGVSDSIRVSFSGLRT
jgi:ubiquinone/menaquinone biosynthesis C-methylase UbiE